MISDHEDASLTLFNYDVEAQIFNPPDSTFQDRGATACEWVSGNLHWYFLVLFNVFTGLRGEIHR